jgi:hypothetical protein
VLAAEVLQSAVCLLPHLSPSDCVLCSPVFPPDIPSIVWIKLYDMSICNTLFYGRCEGDLEIFFRVISGA